MEAVEINTDYMRHTEEQLKFGEVKALFEKVNKLTHQEKVKGKKRIATTKNERGHLATTLQRLKTEWTVTKDCRTFDKVRETGHPWKRTNVRASLEKKETAETEPYVTDTKC